MHEELIKTEFDGAFCQKFKLLVDRFSRFFPKHRKSVEKMIYQKKNWGHRTSKIVKCRQSSSNGHLQYHLFILWLSMRSHVWCGMWICVHSKDVQKQLAGTSLSKWWRHIHVHYMVHVATLQEKATMHSHRGSIVRGLPTVLYLFHWNCRPFSFSQKSKTTLLVGQ